VDAKAAGIKDAEMTMAMQLIEDMTQQWDADSFRNSFADEIHKLIETKAEAGDIADVVKVEREAGAPAGADVLDLTSLLKRSLEGGGRKPASSAKGGSASVTALPSAKGAPAKSATARKAPARKAPAAKTAPATKGTPAKKTGRSAA